MCVFNEVGVLKFLPHSSHVWFLFGAISWALSKCLTSENLWGKLTVQWSQLNITTSLVFSSSFFKWTDLSLKSVQDLIFRLFWGKSTLTKKKVLICNKSWQMIMFQKDSTEFQPENQNFVIFCNFGSRRYGINRKDGFMIIWQSCNCNA